MKPPDAALIEEYLTVADIAQKLKLSEDSVRRLFADEEGVLRIGNGTRLVGRKYRRHYFTLRIPMSVFLRVQDRLSSGAPARARRPR
jgi:AraC-like DNA-binding protein